MTWSTCLLNRVKQQLCDKRKIGSLNLVLIEPGAETAVWSLFCSYYNAGSGKKNSSKNNRFREWPHWPDQGWGQRQLLEFHPQRKYCKQTLKKWKAPVIPWGSRSTGGHSEEASEAAHRGHIDQIWAKVSKGKAHPVMLFVTFLHPFFMFSSLMDTERSLLLWGVLIQEKK